MKKKLIIVISITILIIAVIAGLLLYISSLSTTVPSIINMTADNAKNKLNDAGFTNISFVADKSGDSSFMLDYSNWTVIAQTPSVNSSIKKSDEITVTCKKTTEIQRDADKKDQAKLNTQINEIKSQLDTLVSSSVENAMSKVSELGFTATYLHEQSGLDFTEEISGYDEEQLNGWIVTEVSDFDFDNKTVIITINTSENIDDKQDNEASINELDSKLDSAHAWQAVETYGKSQYPHGFKLHYITDAQTTQPSDENTWFLKSSATVTNAYNAKEELTCEAHVSGTTDNPQVIDFIVY
ncbi:MAG: PASTA domain-containing protein [Hespellia sp.]|nr:PASTA domain-containing protein [Hespellia sp.]